MFRVDDNVDDDDTGGDDDVDDDFVGDERTYYYKGTLQLHFKLRTNHQGF